MSECKSHAVGRNAPPVEHQFSPGMSGNPRGRPKGARGNKAIVQALARKMHTLPDGKSQQRVSTVELLLEILKRKAISGDVQADIFLETLLDRFAPPVQQAGYIVVGETMTKEEMIKAIEIHNRMAEKPPFYQRRGTAKTNKAN